MSRDKQPAKSDGLCSTDEMMSQMNLQDWNELEQQGNNPAQPLEVPQLPAQPDEGPLLPPEGLEHQVLDIPATSQEDGCNVTSSVLTSGNNDGKVERYGPEKRKECIERYRRKRECRNWEKKIRYPERKKLSDNRPRKKGRYVSSSEVEPSHRYGLGASDPDDTGSGSGSASTTQCALTTQQGASLQSQELASQNNEFRSRVHRQVYVGLIPPNWPNAPSESRDETARWEQELHATGLWESNTGGGDDHTSGSGDEADIFEQELHAESDAGGDDHVPGEDPS